MKETQESIGHWADGAFGPAISFVRIAARANEEMAELLKVTSLGFLGPEERARAGEEIADVIISLLRLAHDLEIDAGEEVDRKMQVNRSREWVPDGTGCGYHVKEKKP